MSLHQEYHLQNFLVAISYQYHFIILSIHKYGQLVTKSYSSNFWIFLKLLNLHQTFESSSNFWIFIKLLNLHLYLVFWIKQIKLDSILTNNTESARKVLVFNLMVYYIIIFSYYRHLFNSLSRQSLLNPHLSDDTFLKRSFVNARSSCVIIVQFQKSASLVRFLSI